MKIGQENYSLCFVIIALFFRFATAPTQTTVSEASFTYNGTEFGLFQTSPLINQPNAQTECMNWGGNLATIKSAVEDSLLLYSSPDLNTVFTCHIGLNDIDHEAGTNGDDFVWIDDSTSSYRKWGTLGMDYPITTVNFDCVRNRFRDGGLSQGWVNNPCTTERNCYFCSKPGTSNGCELTYDGSCYKVFEVSTPINWLDAQSSCAIWGGDLTSITTERENNYLNTLITSSVGNCWIGLNDRDDDGTYTWIDGTAVSYTNWTGLPPNAADSDCVQINNAGNGIWESVSCDITLNAILCKRDSPNIIPTGARFGRITNGELEFEALTGNTFFYEPLTLVCGSDGSAVVWRYSQNSNLSGSSALTETYNYVDFSWLDVDNTMQGYYRCTTSNAISHTVGVYDTTLTTVTVTGTSYTYIVGVDRTDVLLLCDPEDGDSLSTLRWSVQNGIEFFNPINLNSESSNLPDVSTSFSCKRGGVTLITTQICVKVPTISISYGVVPVTSYSSVYPAVNALSVPSAVQDITLSINIEGKWTLPDNTNSSNLVLTIPTFSSQENGVYKFYINNWDGVEVCAIQVTLTTTTIIVGVPDTQLTYDNTEFGYFSVASKIDWYTAQLRCLNWGGNLATIKSEEEDSLLFYSTDIQTNYNCYIGLNDILSEASGNESIFTWVDRSSGAYRNFQSGFPLTGVERDCVIFRFIQEEGGDLSVGWVDTKCRFAYNCHFCTKSATSGDCDLIYGGSCYKVFEVTTPINWLDAQSSCAIWGGDLTSITTERENNYLNTLITSSVGNCWIGLNDRSTEGTYTWIDGTIYTQQGFLSIQSNNESNDCVEFDTAGSSWASVDCDTTRGKFLCERESTVTTESRYVVLTNGAVLYQPLISNRFLYNPTLTLVYGIGNFNGLEWKFSTKSDLSDAITLPATLSDPQIGFTSLTMDNSKQGYYYYELSNAASFIVGLYDDSITTVAAEGTTYTYISGVDRQDVLLICDPDDGGSLNLKWDSTLANPVNIFSERSQFQSEPSAFICTRDTTTIVTTHVSVIVPEISVKYYQFLSSSHTDTFSMNTATIPLSTQQVSLSTNLVGYWNIPGDMNTSDSTVDIGTFVQANAGLYTLYTNNWYGVVVIAIQINILSSPALTAMTPEQEFIFDDTRLGFFTDSSNTNWLNAQLNCNSWGGNLATIKSEEEDSLLLYTTTDTHFGCYIGLNDILIEANGNGGDYTWVDGSNSAYRNFAPFFPKSNVNSDCVRFRYKMESGNLSQGWVNEVCSSSYNCHICTKTATSGDCDLFYDGSCYKVFEVSTAINWLDAQSSCAIWGGDLTSITTERENNYINTLISSSVGNCWIGLNDRDEEGTYTWIDGTAYIQQGFLSMQSNSESNDCVEFDTAGISWVSVDCDTASGKFLCERESIVITGNTFGELINGGLDFNLLNVNTFLYRSLTLVCGGQENDVITWRFSENSDLSSNETLTATYSNTGTGLSWLNVENTKQGYYQCQISSSTYTVGVYDTSVTTVAVQGSTYTYLEGIDRENILLLCDPMDNGVLSTLMWNVSYSNPLNIHSVRNSLPTQSTDFSCARGSGAIVSIFLSVTVPTLTVSTIESSSQFSAVYPASNTISLKVRTVDFSLSANLPGRWRLPDDTFTSEQSISYQTLDYQYFALYQYLIINWDGNEVIAIQITLIQNGFVVIYPISISNAPIQNDSTIVVTQDSSMIDCAVSSLSDNVEWMFESQTDGMVTDKTSSATFSMVTGFSTLVVSANEPGDYSCIINAQYVHSFSVADENSLVRVDSFTKPPQQVYFTVNSPVSQLYHPSSAIIQASVSDSDIQWTNDVVENGDDKSYTTEYPNPVDLNTVFSNVGGGLQTFSCFYRMSPVTLVGSVQLVLRDTATITVSYQTSSTTFSDVDNPMFPSAQEIIILIGTTDVMLTCSLSKCIWLVSDRASVITTQTYTIPAITDSYNVNISLMRMTATSVTYTTAHITITSMSSPQTQSSVTAIAAIIIVIILLAVVAVIFTLLLVFFIVRKRGKSKQSNSNLYNIDAKSTSSELPLKTSNVLEYKDDIPLQNFNPAYLPNETITKPEIPEQSPIRDTLYQNIAKVRKVDSPVPKRVASPVVDPKTQLIPLDAFKMHMNRIWQRENALQEEYECLGGKDHRYPCSHAKIEENKIKNRFKLMYPYDKSRVVLSVDPNGDPNSDYVNASLIPGVYVKEKFIGAQAPKENTLQDFWKMIIENKVVNIVMVTNLIESGRKKCEQYFPLKIGQKLEFGPYEIIADKEEVKIGYTIKELSVHYMGKVTNLRHFHFTAWPDHDVPTLYDELLLFVSKVQDGRMKGRAPILVHCSAGVGRTGTFITLYNLSAAIKQTKPISIYNVVHAMREHRPQMVQTYSQYKFIYLSVLEMLLGNTSIPTEEFLDTFGLYMQSETQGYVSVFFQQYSELNYQCEKGFDPVCNSALEPENENKNPVKDILPCDSNRVVLESSNWPGDYINATSLDNGEIILTINPTSDTVRDFNQLVYMVEPSLVVMLCSYKELQQIEQGKSHRIVYWPKHGETLNFDSFTVSCVKSDKTSHFIRNKMNIHSSIDNLNRPFTQIISNQWNDKEETNLESTIHLIKTILEFRKRDPAHPIIIHCDDGAGKSGVVYTVCKAIKDSTEKGSIDIFHTVKKLRNDRMNSVTTLTYFVSCFSLMNEYCSKSQ